MNSLSNISAALGASQNKEVVVVESLSHVRLFATPGTEACQASLCFTISLSLLKLMSIESVMPSSHLILCCPLLLLLSVFSSIRVFSNELALHIRWPKHWSFSFNISPSNEYSGWTFFRIDWLILLFKVLSRVFSSTTVQKHQFFGPLPSIHTHFYKKSFIKYSFILRRTTKIL